MATDHADKIFKELDEVRDFVEGRLSKIEKEYFEEDGGICLIISNPADPEKRIGGKYGLMFGIGIDKIKKC